MAVAPEGDQGQTRAELAQSLWRTALTAGAAQTLLSLPSPAFAQVRLVLDIDGTSMIAVT